MDITYLGHSSFRLKGKTTAVVVDPYADDIGIKFPKISADIVTISHDHSDHNKSSKVKDVKRVIAGPGEYEISGVSIIGMKTYHDEKKGEERGVNTVYVYEIDGVRLCHLGDLGHKLSDKKIGEIGDIDVLFIPVGGVYTIDSKKASELARDMEPRYIVPMHYKTGDLNKKIFGELEEVQKFVSEIGVPHEEMTKLQVKKGLIDEDQKVVILKRK